MPNLAAIVSQTPLYVWVLLAAVVALGVKATRSRVTVLWRAVALPLVFLGLAVSHLLGASGGDLPAALADALVGGVTGWAIVGEGGARRLPDGRLWLKGEWVSLAVMLAEFALHYVEAVARATAAHEVDGVFSAVLAFVGVGLSALAIGRWAARLRAYFASSSPVAELENPSS